MQSAPDSRPFSFNAGINKSAAGSAQGCTGLAAVAPAVVPSTVGPLTQPQGLSSNFWGSAHIACLPGTFNYSRAPISSNFLCLFQVFDCLDNSRPFLVCNISDSLVYTHRRTVAESFFGRRLVSYATPVGLSTIAILLTTVSSHLVQVPSPTFSRLLGFKPRKKQSHLCRRSDCPIPTIDQQLASFSAPTTIRMIINSAGHPLSPV